MELRRRTELDLERALEQLRETRDRYRERDWRTAHLAALRATHRQKRAFQEELNHAGLP
jgi:hypothetical protein